MDRTEIAVMSAIGLSLLTVLVIAYRERAAIPGFAESTSRSVASAFPFTTRTELTNFSAISIRGTWRVNVSQGDDWHVELSQGEDHRDRLRVGVEGDELVLEVTPDSRSFWERWRPSDPPPFATIVMPELREVAVRGVGLVTFSGFSGERLRLSVDGAGTIDGDDGRFEQLELKVKGAGNVEMGDVAFTDAHVDVSGAGNVSMHMDGGVLEGRISGAGNVAYSGSVSDERMTVSGIGNVHRQP